MYVFLLLSHYDEAMVFLTIVAVIYYFYLIDPRCPLPGVELCGGTVLCLIMHLVHDGPFGIADAYPARPGEAIDDHLLCGRIGIYGYTSRGRGVRRAGDPRLW